MNTSVSSHNFTGCTITFLSSSKTFLSLPPKKTPNPLNSNSPSFSLLLSPCKQQLTFCLHGFTNFWIFHINEIMQYRFFFFFFVWLLSLSIMLSRFIHVVAWISTLFFFPVEEYSVVWTTTTCSLNYWWRFGLLPPFGFCECCRYTHAYTCILFKSVFSVLMTIYLEMELLLVV